MNDLPTSNTLLHRAAWVLACATFPLIWWGGLVTTTGAGMAFRDWLTSDGHWMPLYPWFSSTGDKFIEHGHRLLGMTVGVLAIGLVLIASRCEPRAWVRILSWLVLALVIFQGALGGLRVLCDQRTIALLHGCTAPLFFGLCGLMVVVTSRWWQQSQPLFACAATRQLARWTALATLLAYLQIFVGSLVRHGPYLNTPGAAAVFQAAVYVHVLLATALVVSVSLVTWQVRRTGLEQGLGQLLAGLLTLQILLGGFTWVAKYSLPGWAVALVGEMRSANTADDLWQAALVTTHAALGSLILVTSLALALRVARQIRWTPPRVTLASVKRLEVVL